MKILFPFLLFSLFLLSSAQAQFWADLESGLVFGTPYNRVGIPNPGGTRFDLGKELSVQPLVFFRARVGVTINERHTITALYAPLTATYTGQFDREVNFNNVNFPGGQPVTAKYRFNSYRLTYRYALINHEKLRFGLGLTAKIRDANIRLTSGTQDTNFDNFGFVPLLNLLAEYRPTEHWRVLLEADALAGLGPGRAEDVFFGLGYQTGPKLLLRAGYRVVEGGADVESVYNFTWINYASVGATVWF